MREALLALDHIRLNFSEGGLFFLNVTIAFVMFGVALNIKLDEFRDVFVKPKSFITGLISQFLILPAITFLFIMVLKPTPTVALGMILVAACPGGNVSNFLSSLAKGNIALSVSLTAFSTMIAMLMTPPTLPSGATSTSTSMKRLALPNSSGLLKLNSGKSCRRFSSCWESP